MPGYDFDPEFSDFVARLPTEIDMIDVDRVRKQRLFVEDEPDPARPDIAWHDRTLRGSPTVKVRERS